jgi:hypothetical protein
MLRPNFVSRRVRGQPVTYAAVQMWQLVAAGLRGRCIPSLTPVFPFPPLYALDALKDLVQKNMMDVNDVRNELNLLLQRPPRLSRPVSGCSAKFVRREMQAR